MLIPAKQSQKLLLDPTQFYTWWRCRHHHYLVHATELLAKSRSQHIVKQKIEKIQEVRLKVFLKRNSDLSIPSLYKIFKGTDWQERETYDMFGINFIDHPNPKRLLMPEDWRGWPLRKDYIQPDFYELQDAY